MPASFTLCSLSFTAFKVHSMGCWYSVVSSLCLLQSLQTPGSQFSFSVFVKNFSASMPHLPNVRFISCTYHQCFNRKHALMGLMAKGKQATTQFLSLFICSALQAWNTPHWLFSWSIPKSIASDTYGKPSLNPLWQFFFQGCVLVMYLQWNIFNFLSLESWQWKEMNCFMCHFKALCAVKYDGGYERAKGR